MINDNFIVSFFFTFVNSYIEKIHFGENVCVIFEKREKKNLTL